MSLQDQPIGQLMFKVKLLEAIIDEYKDDPRVGEPMRQLKIIQDEIAFREDRDKKQDKDAEHLIVGLRTLDLRGSSELKR
jgi:hypothetical protein